jgi:parvulin-like peptidyl-prolyl isomerase
MATGVGDVEAAKRFRGVEGIATSVTRSGYLGSLGREPEIVGALFSTPPGTWSRPLTGNNGAAVGYVMERQRPKEDDCKTQAPQLRGALLSTARQEVFQDWMESARKNATIEDFRENYFEV